MGRSSSTQTSNQTQTTRLPEFQQGAVEQYFRELMGALGNQDLRRQAFPGELVAGPTATEREARFRAGDFARGGATDLANQAAAANQFLLDPERILNPANIPGFSGVQGRISDQITRNLTNDVLPRLRTGSILSGDFGGSRGVGQEDRAISGATGDIADALAGLEFNTYQSGLQAMQNALGLAPSTAALGTVPAEILSGIGARERADQQAQIDADVRRHEFEQNEPLQFLSALQGLIGQAGQFGGTTTGTTTSTQSQKPSGLQTLGTLGALALAPFTFGGSLAGLGAGAAAAAPSFIPSVGAGQAALLPQIQQSMAPGGAFSLDRLGLNLPQSLAPVAQQGGFQTFPYTPFNYTVPG